ncbi:MAG: HEAT repeat domain-containing protein [Bryobacteraceae bacterium]
MPSDKVFYELINEDYVSRLSQDGVKDFLSLAQKLLHDPRPDARKAGGMCFVVVTLRRSGDSEDLIEPYVPDLLAIVADRTDPLRPLASQVLSSTLPRPSPKTLAYLAAHLADTENTPQDTGWMACILLKDGNDPRIIHDVIAFVHKQGKPEVIQDVLTCFRVLPIKMTPDALSLISSGLDSPDVWVRRRAVEAVAALPLVERSPFLAQLNRLASNPKEQSEIRSTAAEALTK